MLIAGTIADIDSLSAYFGPSIFLTFNRTYFHSLVAALLFSLLVMLAFVLRKRGPTETQPAPLPIFTAALESRTYRGESPRKVAAFAESGSPFRWHGIVETESALREVEIDVGPAASFDPDSAITSYKPEPSAALDAA